MKIKLADYVADFIARQGVRHVFAVSGGASLHLIHSIANHPELEYITPHHEQAAAMAADGYARVTGGLGVAIATSGPGATNLITGIGCSYYDSVSVLYITGQVSTIRMVGNTGVRQIGFQETPIVEMCQTITNYAVQLKKPEMIRYELEKAVYLAKAGRQGPVLVDIPDDFQRAIIEQDTLVGYIPDALEALPLDASLKNMIMGYISKAQRPVLVLGWGVHLSGAEQAAIAFAEALSIPVALTWGAADILPASHPLYIGTFGTHGQRHANFAVQNADLIISLGARLDTKATGTPVNSFARDAVKIMVDIDEAELNKFPAFGLQLDVKIQSDVTAFLRAFDVAALPPQLSCLSLWHEQISQWRDEFTPVDDCQQALKLNPYALMRSLSEALPPSANLFVDTGCAIAWSMQGLRLNTGQRIFHDFNNTAMGWALPATIGGYFAKPELLPIALVGDGSFMMTMYELATILHHRIPLKLLLLNNSGYAMIRQTQDQWLGSHYHASSHAGGLSFPNFKALAEAFNMQYVEADTNQTAETMLKQAFASEGAYLCNIIVPPEAKVVPQVKFGRPNEDMEPYLPREVFLQQMITEPLEVSKY